MLVVRPGARFRQPPGVRPALPQPSGQRLPRPGPGAAGGTCRGPSCSDAGAPVRGSTDRAIQPDHRRRGDFVLRVAGRRRRTAWTSAPAPCTARSSWCGEVLFGSDGSHLYLRVDFSEPDAAGIEARLTLEGDGGQGSAAFIRVQIDHEAATHSGVDRSGRRMRLGQTSRAGGAAGASQRGNRGSSEVSYLALAGRPAHGRAAKAGMAGSSGSAPPAECW